MNAEVILNWLHIKDRYPAAKILPVLDTADLISHSPQDWYLKDHEIVRETIVEWKNFCDQAYKGRAIVSEGVLNPDSEASEAIDSFLLADEILTSVSPLEKARVLESARHLFSVASGQEQGSISAREVSDTRTFVGLFEKAMMGQSPLLIP